MKLTDLFKKNSKAIEDSKKAIEKLQGELPVVQKEKAELTTQRGQLQNALNVIKASLIIDPDDKDAGKKQKQATKKIQDLEKKINELAQIESELQGSISKAGEEKKFFEGELFMSEYAKDFVSYQVVKQVGEKLEKNLYGKNDRSPDWVEIAKAYKLPLRQELTPSGKVSEYERHEDMPFLREKRDEAEKAAKEKTQEIVQKTIDYMNELLKAEGIKNEIK